MFELLLRYQKRNKASSESPVAVKNSKTL
ncbi:hypothetical protein MED217_03310 [Leeuwenhoekiella blandensis MED217]|uniref:Uncharacterized protein n=1 Tax=Leeuwenhoekiella blandensis (strain CECT 7118 / CCUG 51940 / KCTC 22103 / MED217) TaxID=398720 RepID=A3XJX8_LEEBM|nr:hypothetical protein MED217_03310 [Leeuwenhoekiella blandensis MED217]